MSHVGIFAIGIAVGAVATAQTNTFPASGNVGIGTLAPGAPLQVAGTGWAFVLGEASNSSGHQLLLGVNNSGNGYGTIQSVFQGTAFTPLVLNANGGNVGVGTTNPSVPLEASTPTGGNPAALKVVRTGGNVPGEGPVLEFDDFNNSAPQGHMYTSMLYLGGSGYTTGKLILGSHGNASNTSTIFNDELTLFGGNVGIGTTNPQAKLEINGNLRFTGDGSLQTTAWTGVLCGGDYAESVDVTGDRTKYGPGDVLVIDPDDSGKFSNRLNRIPRRCWVSIRPSLVRLEDGKPTRRVRKKVRWR
jgi:hypothetical protein